MRLIDSHCHLDDERFDSMRNAVIERANQAGVDSIVLPATTAARWPRVKTVASEFPGIYPAYGLHPMFIEQHQQQHIAELDKWLDLEKPVAVGECGVDFFQSKKDADWQWHLFKEQLQLANNHQLPVIVHVRKGLDEVLACLRRTALKGGVIHSFSGSLQQAQQLVDLNFKLGIAATVGFERAKKLRKIVSEIETSALLIESDAPDQPGPQYRGQLNEPGYIPSHLQVMAELRGCSLQDLAVELNRNACELFGIAG